MIPHLRWRVLQASACMPFAFLVTCFVFGIDGSQ